MRHLGRVLATSSAVAALLALGGGSASARFMFPISTYKVTYDGSGTYSVKQSDGPSHGEISATFHWKVTYLLSFIRVAGHQVAGLVNGANSSGGGDWSIASDNGGGDVCSRSGGLRLGPYGMISGRVQRSGKVAMQLVPANSDFVTLNGSSGSTACDTTDFWHDWVVSFSKVGNGDLGTVDPLTAFVTLSKRELGFGKVVVNVSNHTLAEPSLTVGSDCGSGNGASCTQSFDWRGTVTFVKTKRR